MGCIFLGSSGFQSILRNELLLRWIFLFMWLVVFQFCFLFFWSYQYFFLLGIFNLLFALWLEMKFFSALVHLCSVCCLCLWAPHLFICGKYCYVDMLIFNSCIFCLNLPRPGITSEHCQARPQISLTLADFWMSLLNLFLFSLCLVSNFST